MHYIVLCVTRYHVWKEYLMSDLFDNWTIQARKGILEFAVLAALADKECYAYELVKAITDIRVWE